MDREVIYTILRAAAALSIFTSGLMEAVYQPSSLDLYNGMAVGLTIFTLWRC